MKKLMTSIAVAMIFAAPAVANDTMDAMLAGTVVYTYPDGTSVTADFHEDGTYTTDSAGDGTWTIEGDELCIKTADELSGCTALEPGHGAGDSWEALDAFGNAVTITIQ